MKINDLPKCRLCLENDADKTGSHIISAFAVKSMIGERGKEKSYLMSVDPTANYMENVGDKPIKEDFIMCVGCEQRLSYVESYVSEELTNKIRKDNFKDNFPEKRVAHTNFIECKRLNSYSFHIFVYSLLWRMAIIPKSPFHNFNPDEDLVEAMRSTLDALLPPRKNYKGVLLDRKVWFKQLEENRHRFEVFKYLLFMLPNTGDTTGDFITHEPKHLNPIGIMLNDMLIYFPINEASTDDMYQLLKKYNKKELYNPDTLVKIIPIKLSKWKAIRNNLKSSFVSRYLKNTSEIYRNEYIKRGIFPTDELLNKTVFEHIKLKKGQENTNEDLI